jgi:hypothetical protein
MFLVKNVPFSKTFISSWLNLLMIGKTFIFILVKPWTLNKTSLFLDKTFISS